MSQQPSHQQEIQGKRLRDMLAAEGQGLPFLGFRIFKWLLLVIAVMTGLIALFAWQTYPDASAYLPSMKATPSGTASPRPPTAEELASWQTAEASWRTSVKDIGQLFLLTPVFPLLGAVIGYIFGREKPTAG